ncbi:MAG: AtpZ/AtpI family protein [Firmicutes bacterium]|nr:AtpZ/AtpI family protein [Bacillota bacterium]
MSQNPWKYLGLFTQIALTIILSVAICTLIGLYLDKLFGTTIILTLIFIFLGVASGLWTAYQILIKISLDDWDK